jgi:hypothetical protein
MTTIQLSDRKIIVESGCEVEIDGNEIRVRPVPRPAPKFNPFDLLCGSAHRPSDGWVEEI